MNGNLRFTGATDPADGGKSLVLGNTAKGTQVYNFDGDRIGRIEGVMIDRATGAIVSAIVSFKSGSGAGFDADCYRIPWSLLTYNPRFDLGITGTHLQRAITER
jgi:sporulation protein YlmC with PRC-barrel domain